MSFKASNVLELELLQRKLVAVHGIQGNLHSYLGMHRSPRAESGTHLIENGGRSKASREQSTASDGRHAEDVRHVVGGRKNSAQSD